MLLAIDVGNTNIVLGVFDKDVLLKSFRAATSVEKSRDEYGMFFCRYLPSTTSLPRILTT